MTLLSELRIWRSHGVGHRLGSDLALLWVWCRPLATALIKPLAWELPQATGAALEKAERQKTKQNKTNKQTKPEGLSKDQFQ